jgi:hypothetical protein
MRDTLKQDLVVGPGGIIEIHAPNLPVGSVAEVIVRLKKPVQSKLRFKDVYAETSKDLGWPPDFFELTFGSLRDTPMIRESQGRYETRDEIV